MESADSDQIEPDESVAAARQTGSETGYEPALLFCPLCSARLAGHRCKLVCQVCGYFMSCADYY